MKYLNKWYEAVYKGKMTDMNSMLQVFRHERKFWVGVIRWGSQTPVLKNLTGRKKLERAFLETPYRQCEHKCLLLKRAWLTRLNSTQSLLHFVLQKLVFPFCPTANTGRCWMSNFKETESLREHFVNEEKKHGHPEAPWW